MGRCRRLSTRIFPIKGLDGEVSCIVIIHEDVSNRKLAEKENADLELKLQRLKNMTLLGTLTGGVAHDLNNIFSPLVGYPEMMLETLPASRR